jgi:phospholipid N-methyltransferase
LLVTRQAAATSRLHGLRDSIRDAAQSQAERAGRFRRIAGRAENGTAPVAVSSWQLFPTPAAVAERMMDAAELAPGLRVLEPSAGTGNLVRAMLARGVRAEDVTACEVSAVVAREFARDFPTVPLVVDDFLEQSAVTLGGPFDRIVANPPFHRGEDARHILHAAGMLAPGGVLVGLCYDGRAFREELRDICWTHERLPAGSFREAGTRADVVMVVMKAGEVRS